MEQSITSAGAIFFDGGGRATGTGRHVHHQCTALRILSRRQRMEDIRSPRSFRELGIKSVDAGIYGYADATGIFVHRFGRRCAEWGVKEMDVSIIVALVSGLVAIVTVIINVRASNKEMTAKLERTQAVMETKLDNLITEVREHNNFAKRMPVVEEQIKVINHRLDDLEKKGGA